jgi:endonuclease/exonuclease/phosphatase (EEP) superfamily protein YafD
VIAALAVVAGLVAVMATAASFSRDWRWALLAHFRPHLAVTCGVLALLVTAVDLPLGPKIALLASLVAAAAVARAMSRTFTAAGVPTQGNKRLRIAFANLLRENRDAQRAIDWVRREKVDIFVAAETQDHWPEALAALTDELPHVAGHRWGDVLVFSRHPVVGEPQHVFANVGYAVAVEIEGITVVAVHTASPQMRALSLACDELLEKVGRLVPSIPGPIVAIGDFNATPWSAPIAKLIAETGLAYGPGARIGTFPAVLGGRPVPKWLALPIDLVLAGHGASVAERRHGPRLGSDHWPVIAEIQFSSPP